MVTRTYRFLVNILQKNSNLHKLQDDFWSLWHIYDVLYSYKTLASHIPIGFETVNTKEIYRRTCKVPNSQQSAVRRCAGQMLLTTAGRFVAQSTRRTAHVLQICSSILPCTTYYTSQHRTGIWTLWNYDTATPQHLNVCKLYSVDVCTPTYSLQYKVHVYLLACVCVCVHMTIVPCVCSSPVHLKTGYT